jgi:hypothetical protein
VYSGDGIIRATIDFTGSTPTFVRRRWLTPPHMVETAGESFQVTPDGRILFVQTVEPVHPRYLRVIPDWVRQMKRAVDQANR